jgi:hypothetical protein
MELLVPAWLSFPCYGPWKPTIEDIANPLSKCLARRPGCYFAVVTARPAFKRASNLTHHVDHARRLFGLGRRYRTLGTPIQAGVLTEGEADQDRREGGEPRTLRRLPDGRGRHPAANVPGDFAADRGTTAAAATSAGVRRSMVMHSRVADGRSASQMPGKIARSAPRPPFGPPPCLASREARKITSTHASSGVLRGMSASR